MGMEIKEMTTEIEDTILNETRLFIGGVPKNVTNEMIIARFAAVPQLIVKEASCCLLLPCTIRLC